MTMHLEESFQRDFERLRERITKMGALAVRGLQDCVEAMSKPDPTLAQLIIIRDQRIDQMEKEVDQACLEFLLRHQPVGRQLRFAFAALKIDFELERVGDYAESIARQILKLRDLNCVVPPSLFGDISTASISMLRSAVNAFLGQDAGLAEATAQIEERVDLLRNQANSELMHLVQNNHIPLAALTPLMTIARRFERVSDQAKSMCLETIYIQTGDYAKHAGTGVMRVLFVDADHGCLSRLAEALGRCLQLTSFEFASAGIEPRAMVPELARFLQAKMLPVPTSDPRPLPAPADLGQYQVVITFSPNVRAKLPQPTRKSAHLEWAIADPCETQSSGDQAHVSLEKACQTISNEITRLIAVLMPEEQEAL